MGTRIWQLLQEYGDIQCVFNTMLDEYDVDAGQLKTDIDELLVKMEEAGLVCSVDGENK